MSARVELLGRVPNSSVVHIRTLKCLRKFDISGRRPAHNRFIMMRERYIPGGMYGVVG